MIELISAKGIDYLELEKLLKAQEWGKASHLTAKHILQASECEKEGYIDIDKVKTFPCEDLMTIDRLWMKYSDGVYGFSVQRNIYVECGGSLDFSSPSDICWQRFLEKRSPFPDLDRFLVKQQSAERRANLSLLWDSIVVLAAASFGLLWLFLPLLWWFVWWFALLAGIFGLIAGIFGLIMCLTSMMMGVRKWSYSVLLLSQVDVCRIKIDQE
jgi:hypothetical protein